MAVAVRRLRRPSNRIAVLVLAAAALGGCGINSVKRSYVMAESLWTDGKYAAAVAEFDRVVAKDPGGKLGLMALNRAATTQALFLNQYAEAIRKFRVFAEISPEADAAWEARRQIGEILFSKTESYEEAIVHYTQMLGLRPQSPESPEFMFRIGKSHFYLRQFNEAVQTYREILQKYPGSQYAEKALFETGITLYTRGGSTPRNRSGGPDYYQQAIDEYEKFIKAYPSSDLVSQARFGIANCLEDMDLLDQAYQAYLALRGKYLSPNVIEIKLARIKERKSQRIR